MIIRAISFDPLVYTIDGVVAPTSKTVYKDEKGEDRELVYIMKDGEKLAVQHQSELTEKLSDMKVDEALAEVEAKRIENTKLEDVINP